MKKSEILKDENVYQIEYHIPDEWYGSNVRILLTKTGEKGFENEKEAKEFRSTFLKYVKLKSKKNSCKKPNVW